MKVRAILPNLITLGNGICGFAALVKILKVNVSQPAAAGMVAFDQPGAFDPSAEPLVIAAWLILLGMAFDVFDGKVARLSGKTSDFGAQLDSLCDLITFGLAPAALVVRLNMIYARFWGNLVWFFALAYFLGAMLRLARFNAENEHDESAHLCFKGLPTPGAAGCIASLVILHGYLVEQFGRPFAIIPLALPLLAITLGFIMVSNRLKYDHLAGRVFNRSQSFDFFVYLIFGAIVILLLPEVFLPLIFLGYLLQAPVRLLFAALRRKGTDAAAAAALGRRSRNGGHAGGEAGGEAGERDRGAVEEAWPER